jgi:hypothetical protein
VEEYMMRSDLRDAKLSGLGIEQAMAAGLEVDMWETTPGLVVCSPLSRAIATVSDFNFFADPAVFFKHFHAAQRRKHVFAECIEWVSSNNLHGFTSQSP